MYHLDIFESYFYALKCTHIVLYMYIIRCNRGFLTISIIIIFMDYNMAAAKWSEKKRIGMNQSLSDPGDS